MSFLKKFTGACLRPFTQSVAGYTEYKQTQLNHVVARLDDVIPKGEGAVLRWLADYSERADVIGLDGQVDRVRQKLIDAGYDRGVETNGDDPFAVAKNGIAGAVIEMASGYAPNPVAVKDVFLARYNELVDAALSKLDRSVQPHA
jgi:hypothetical protein